MTPDDPRHVPDEFFPRDLGEASLAELHGLITLLLADLHTGGRRYTRNQVLLALRETATVARTADGGFLITGDGES